MAHNLESHSYQILLFIYFTFTIRRTMFENIACKKYNKGLNAAINFSALSLSQKEKDRP